ncbi:MAG: HEAT repeat domain-containing protein [Acidobacteria bacterium]|nr:HEAT repeat domain-containing protein [Acidobacteriota bacterium]
MLWWTLQKLRWEWTRGGAVDALSKSRHPRVVEALTRVLRDGREPAEARAAAAVALGNLQDSRAMEPLIAALADNNSEVRWSAALSVGELGGRRAVEGLTAKLCAGDVDSQVLRSAAGGLVRCGEAGQAPLAAALQDSRRSVRYAVVSAMAYSMAADQHLRYYDSVAVALEDDDEGIRHDAARGLLDLARYGRWRGSAGPPSLVRCLLAVEPGMNEPSTYRQTLQDADRRLQEAVGGIKEDWWKTLEARHAVPYLVDKLKSLDFEVSLVASRLLAKIGDSRAAGAVMAWLADERTKRYLGEDVFRARFST